MKTLPLYAAAAALLSLSACENKPEVVDSRAPDPMAERLKNAAPVELPPAIAASITFRCQPGNSLLYVDFFQGDKMVVLKTEKGGAPKVLKAAAAGEPYVAEGGYKVTGTSKSATIEAPGVGTKSCKS
ncbi:MAG: hypothetical protein V4574_20380 [Pseudomonadota bacterium]